MVFQTMHTKVRKTKFTILKGWFNERHECQWGMWGHDFLKPTATSLIRFNVLRLNWFILKNRIYKCTNKHTNLSIIQEQDSVQCKLFHRFLKVNNSNNLMCLNNFRPKDIHKNFNFVNYEADLISFKLFGSFIPF